VLGVGVAGLVAPMNWSSSATVSWCSKENFRTEKRIHTYRFGTGAEAPVTELGVMRIPTDHALTLCFVDKRKLRAVLPPFCTILCDEKSYLRIGRNLVQVREAPDRLVEQVRRRCRAVSYRRQTLLFTRWLSAVVDAIGARELGNGVQDDLATMLRALDHLDLTPYCHGHWIDLRVALRDHPELRQAYRRRLDGCIDDVVRKADGNLVYLAGRMRQLTDRLAEVIRGPILITGQEVIGIDVRPDGVWIKIDDGGSRPVIPARAGTVHDPFAVLSAGCP
jgi:hypothetical protein